MCQRRKAREQEWSSLAWFKVAQQICVGWRNWSKPCQSDLSHQPHHETVLSPLPLLGDSMPAKYKEYLLVQGWSWYFHSGYGMNVLSSLHNTNCQLQQILAYSSAFPTVHSYLPSNTAKSCCTLLSSLGFCWVLSGHHSALVTEQLWFTFPEL